MKFLIAAFAMFVTSVAIADKQFDTQLPQWRYAFNPLQTSIYFGYDDTKVPENIRHRLFIAAWHMGNHTKLESVTVVGHADRAGSNSYNRDLGAERASAAAKVFREVGYEKVFESTVSEGEEMPAVITEDGEEHPANRRVVITQSS
jgi:OOP family OmpA-OmpF porin|tara:strand:- start:210 stop:647 length:438 start_codon:yes stop_codon:yes gene_type:complete